MSFASPPNIDDDSDSISLTSTIVNDDEGEYVVEGVHAEDVQNGKTVFLIEWANYDVDWCTWEPRENLSEVLQAQWEEKKATDPPSVSRDFVARYETAHNKKLEESRQRHHRRNAIRRRLGKPTTSFWFRGQEWPDSDDENEAPQEIADSEAELLSDSSDESREAREENAIDYRASAATIKLSQSKPSSSKSKDKKSARPEKNSIFGKFQPGDQKSVSSKRTDAKSSKGSGSTSERPKSSKQASRDRERPSATGYQGSAQRVSTASPAQPAGVNTKLSASLAVKTIGATVAASNAKFSIDRPDKTTASKATISTGTAPPAHKSSSGSASARVQTADKGKSIMKRTAKPAVNIFVGEAKKKKTKTSVAELEIDKTQEPRHFDNHKQIRKAQLRARDRDDQAPPIEKINPAQVYAPGLKLGLPQQEHTSKDVRSDAGGSAEVAAPPQEQCSTMPPLQVARSSSMADIPIPVRVSKRPLRSVLSSIADRPRKMAKSVRFTETELGPSSSQEAFQRISSMPGERFPQKGDPVRFIDDDDDDGLFVGEPMDIDDDADSPNGAAAGIPSVGPRKLDLSTYKSRSQALKGVNKKIELLTSTRLLDVFFEGFPSNSAQDTEQWLRDFLGIECLRIGHTFLAESLVNQLGTLTNLRPLCSGFLTSNDSSESLDVIAEHLRLESSGLFMAQELFNLVLYPTKCAEFNGLSELGVEPLSPGPDNVALRYFIFSSPVPIFQLIRPPSSLSKGLKSTVGKEKLLLFPTILGMQYSPLIAPFTQKKDQLNFYLAFAERALSWQHSIASWLTMRNPKCKIYTNFDAGSWLAFFDVMKEEGQRGIIIIHEALVPFIRRMPHLYKLLKTKFLIVWQFSEAMGAEPPRRLVNSNIVPVISTRFSRMFPLGHVILLTPSFLVSEPRESYKLLTWFFTQRAKSQTNKLVLAYNIVEFLSGLSKEKTEYRTRLKQGAWRNKRELDIAVEKNAGALTDDDMATRQKIWFSLDTWLSEQTGNEIPFSELNSVIFADRSIDPHDEQSLVNWFGIWSTMHWQDYRRFYVVGSSGQQPTGPGDPSTPRTTKTVQIPKYHPSVVNDPDEAARNTLRKAGHAFTPNFVFQSQCFANDEARIEPWLALRAREGRETSMRNWNKDTFWALCNKPVSWAHGDMADHLGDSTMQFATIKQWWDTIRPWTIFKNTYIAFFYTISDDEWRPENFPKGMMPKRHAWLAIWRPCEVHFKKDVYAHGKTELVIWDTRAGDQLEAKNPLRLRDLTWMQRALVEYIRLHAHEKNTGSFLHRIWVGGFQAQRAEFNLTSTLPVDLTAEMLGAQLLLNLNNAVPSPPHALELRQYRQIDETPPDPSRTNPTALLYGDEKDPDSRIIIHPPRGSENLQPESPSRCSNGLFEASRLARLQQGGYGSGYVVPQNHMVYTFPPTMSWYRNQVAEGRHFGHIMVNEWEKVMKELIDNRGASAPASTTSARPPQNELSRNNSVSSNHSSSTY